MLTLGALLVVSLVAPPHGADPAARTTTIAKCSLALLDAGLCDGNNEDHLNLEETLPGNPAPPVEEPAPQNPSPDYPQPGVPSDPNAPQQPAEPPSPADPDGSASTPKVACSAGRAVSMRRSPRSRNLRRPPPPSVPRSLPRSTSATSRASCRRRRNRRSSRSAWRSRTPR
jgi:hypothetical protein